MEMFKLRSFLRDNSTKDNIKFVFPSNEDVTVDPDLFMAAVVTRGEDFNELTLEFLRQFLRDLYDGKIGECIRLCMACKVKLSIKYVHLGCLVFINFLSLLMY